MICAITFQLSRLGVFLGRPKFHGENSKEEVPIVLVESLGLASYIKGDYVCKDGWAPQIIESHDVQMELNTPIRA